jgi:ATP-dependent DNA ligase
MVNFKMATSANLLGEEHLKQFLDSILAKGGEGVILREPQSLYKAGRSSSLCKYKPFFDTEVKVLENNFPHGFTCKQYDNFGDIF